MAGNKRQVNEPEPRPIIVKKIIVDGHGGHHGGAWKVAYADFVTAMMAFFLLRNSARGWPTISRPPSSS